MKLITKAIQNKVPALYSQEKAGKEAIVYAKFFTTWNYRTWYMTEYNPETGEEFGYVKGNENEIGYFNINELEAYTHRSGLKIERDKYFTPKTLGEIMEGQN